MNKWNNKFRYQVASCWLFILSYTTMHGSMNIKSETALLETAESERVQGCACTNSTHLAEDVTAC